MRRILLTLAVLAASTIGTTAADAATDPRQLKATWSLVTGNLSQPVAMTHAPGESARMFVTQRSGKIRVIRNGVLKATPFLDLTSRVRADGEGGLLSIAFRADYATSGVFFVLYTDANLTIRLRRFRASPPSSDTAIFSGVDVLSIPHPTNTNHFGGQLQIGPGGYLFLSTGDGGGGEDPKGNAQNLDSLLGKILRIDVTHYTAPRYYSVPPANPYAGATPGRGEIWASGLRNPWRFSFDKSSTPYLWIGDVGEGDREEVDRISVGGRNLGWDCREGTVNTASTYGGSYCRSSGYTLPLHQYAHDLGCAIIGGYTYRGTKYATLAAGEYLFGDYCSGRLWLLGTDSSGRRVVGQVATFPGNILAFGRDNAGELYLLSASGGLYRLAFARR